MDRTVATRRFPGLVGPPARLSGAHRELQEIAQRPRREDRLAPADVPVGEPHEDERQTAVRYWKKAVEIAVEMGVDTMNSEFGRAPRPTGSLRQLLRRAVHTEIQRGRLVALDGGPRAGVREGGCQPPHRAASGGLVRDLASGGRHDPHDRLKNVKFLYCAPHTFYFGDDIAR